jgi:hypothetical protein
LCRGIRICRTGNVALKADNHFLRQCQGTRVNCYSNRWSLASVALARYVDPGAEVPQCADKIAHIALRKQHEASEFRIFKVCDSAILFQLNMTLQQFGDFVRRTNYDVESRHISCRVRRSDRV